MKSIRLSLSIIVLVFLVALTLSAFIPVKESSMPGYVSQDFNPDQSEINRRLELEIELIKSEIKVKNAKINK